MLGKTNQHSLGDGPLETRLHTVLAEKARRFGDGRGQEVYSVQPDTNAADAIRRMCQANVGCVLVIEDGTLLGIFSEREVLKSIADKGRTPDQFSVRDVMNRNYVMVSPDLTVEDALVQCTDRRVRHLPVAQEGQLLGLLSIGDLVSFVVKDKDRTIEGLIDYIHGPQMQV